MACQEKMPDGGFRPAYNVHLVSDTVSKVIIAVNVDNIGTHTHAMVPLAQQVEERYNVRPEQFTEAVNRQELATGRDGNVSALRG